MPALGMQPGIRPKVSVCLATYNHASYVRASVMSVLEQAADIAIELLVGDDCSTDSTAEIVFQLMSQFPGRIQLVRRESNFGGTENYQDLVRRATGEFIAHLDGDDAWLPGKLSAQIAFMSQHPQCVAVYTNAVVEDEQGRALGTFTNAQPEVMDFAYLSAKGNFLMHSSVLYRSDLKETYLRLQPPVLDYLMHLTFARQGPVGFINQKLAVYRRGTVSSMTRNSFPTVQRLFWSAALGAIEELAPHQRQAAAAHLAALIIIAQMRGQPFAISLALITEAASKLGCWRATLLARSIPHTAAILLHGLRQRLLIVAGRGSERVLFARI